MEETQVPLIYDVPNILSNICGLIGISIFVYKLIRMFKFRDNGGTWTNGIWFAGLIAFLIRLAGQMYHIGDMFNAVYEAQDPDLNVIAGGLSIGIFSSLKGLFILTTLLIFWGLVKGLITYRKAQALKVQKR